MAISVLIFIMIIITITGSIMIITRVMILIVKSFTYYKSCTYGGHFAPALPFRGRRLS